MKFNSFRFILLSSIVIFLSSCLGTTADTTVISSDASFVSLTFAKNDSIPNIQNAVFTLDVNGKTIVNVDSLPYQTRIDSVFPAFKFTSTSAAYLHFQGDSVLITGKDTVNFSQPKWIRNFATDKKTFKDYQIKVNVHQVKPELYIWSKVSDNLDSRNVISQKAIIINDTIRYYVSDGTSTYLYYSKDGYVWSSSITVSGLPNNVSFGDMTQFNGKLYLTQAGAKIYTSIDGINWTTKSIIDYNFKSLLFGLNGKIWAVTQSITDLKNYFASSTDGITWVVNTTVVFPVNFPVNDFAALSFASRTGKPKAIVVGGKSANGDVLKSNWSTENGTYWVDFSLESKSLDKLAAGASIIAYDNKLFLFGIRNDTVKNHFQESIDEGLTWHMPDSIYNYLPADYQPRSYQSVVVFKPLVYDKSNPILDPILKSNRIFIIGGKTSSTILSDVWTGKLNRKNFLRQ